MRAAKAACCCAIVASATAVGSSPHFSGVSGKVVPRCPMCVPTSPAGSCALGMAPGGPPAAPPAGCPAAGACATTVPGSGAPVSTATSESKEARSALLLLTR